MPQGSKAHEPQLLSLGSRAGKLQLLELARALQWEKPPQ